MNGLQEDITKVKQLCRIFCARGSRGLDFIRMLKNNVMHAMYVKGWKIHLGGMKCLYIHMLHCKCLINGR
jgi:hypothetical protein